MARGARGIRAVRIGRPGVGVGLGLAALAAVAVALWVWTRPSAPPPAGDPSRRLVVFLGDSITRGFTLPPQQAFPHLVGEALGVPVRNAGVNGDTTAGGLARLGRDVLAWRPGVVVVELGANDFFRRRPVAETLGNLAAIVRRIRAEGAAVVLIHIRLGVLADPYLQGYRELAQAEGALLVEDFLGEILRTAGLTLDGLHPSAEGHRRLADRLVPALRPLLTSLTTLDPPHQPRGRPQEGPLRPKEGRAGSVGKTSCAVWVVECIPSVGAVAPRTADRLARAHEGSRGSLASGLLRLEPGSHGSAGVGTRRKGTAMKTSRVPASFLLILAAVGASLAGRAARAEESGAWGTVKRDSVPVYSQMSPRGDVLAVLEKGARVRIDFALIGPAGGWCGLVMDGLRGYARCDELDREPRRGTHRPADLAARETPPGPPDAPRPASPSTAPAASSCQDWLKGDEGEQPLRLPANFSGPTFWVCALRLTEEQMARARELAARTGLLECGRMVAAQTRDAEVERRCRGGLLAFWKEFPAIMTPEQRAAFDQALATTRHPL